MEEFFVFCIMTFLLIIFVGLGSVFFLKKHFVRFRKAGRFVDDASLWFSLFLLFSFIASNIIKANLTQEKYEKFLDWLPKFLAFFANTNNYVLIISGVALFGFVALFDQARIHNMEIDAKRKADKISINNKMTYEALEKEKSRLKDLIVRLVKEKEELKDNTMTLKNEHVRLRNSILMLEENNKRLLASVETLKNENDSLLNKVNEKHLTQNQKNNLNLEHTLNLLKKGMNFLQKSKSSK